MGNEVVIDVGRRKKEGFVEARLVTTSNEMINRMSIIHGSLKSNVNDNAIINEDYHDFVLNNHGIVLSPIGRTSLSVKDDILSNRWAFASNL